VNCAVCGSTLATPTGGEAEFTGEVVETVEKRAERNEA
jgi:small subunit ribosomal protein S27e